MSADRTALFADLRGSTGLYERLGNAAAAARVAASVERLLAVVKAADGMWVKALGDGLMAVFDDAEVAVRVADTLHAVLAPADEGRDSSAVLQLRIGLARGEILTVGHECFGDAVNVAARLLAHAGDGETLGADSVVQALPIPARLAFRPLGPLHLRGRNADVEVHLRTPAGTDGFAATAAVTAYHLAAPLGIRLRWQGQSLLQPPESLPVILGRGADAGCRITDPRVSRSHARIDWHAGSFLLTDLSFNGSCVRHGTGPVVVLRRGTCTLTGRGSIGLGGAPHEGDMPTLDFEIVAFDGIDPAPDTAFQRLP